MRTFEAGKEIGPFTENAARYRKTATVLAIKIEEPFVVKTLEGEMTGQPGDFLAIGDHGDCWPIKSEIFEATYEQV